MCEINLAIVVLEKDRLNFLKRWLNFNSNFGLFPVYIADGSLESLEIQISDLFLNQDLVNFNYYGHDKDIKSFILKTICVLKEVKEKFTMLASDDDFINFEVLNDFCEFLEQNPDFVAIYGSVLDFGLSIRPNIETSEYGEIRYLRPLGVSRSYLSDNYEDRIESYLAEGGKSFWHAVVKTQDWVEIWDDALKIGVQTYEALELFVNLRLIMKGKIYTDVNHILMLHQVHVTMIAHQLMKPSEKIINPEYLEDLQSISKFLNIGPEEFLKLDNTNQKVPLIFCDSFVKRFTQALIVPSSFVRKVIYKFKEIIEFEPKLKMRKLNLNQQGQRFIERTQVFLRDN